MKKLLLAAAALGALVAGSANAEGKISYNVAATSDYVWRGVTQNASDVALQGGIDYTNGIFYAGGWASNVSYADREIDLYAGVKPSIGKFAFDFGAIYYNYNDEDLNNTDLKAAVSYPLGTGTIGAAYYSNVDIDDFDYYEVNAAYPLTDKLSISGALGEQKDLYTTGNVGVTYAITPVWSLDVRYSDTNLPKAVKDGSGRVAVLIKAAF